MPRLPVLITTPHSSGFVPFAILAEMLAAEVHDLEQRQQRLRHLFYAGDPFTDAIFHVDGASHVQALTSRFVVDLNRHRYHQGDNGVIKLTDFNEAHLYPEGFQLSAQAREGRLVHYWDPFHERSQYELARPDIDFFIDGHAMSNVGPSIGPDRGKPRPGLCLMTGGDEQGEAIGDIPISLPAQVAQRVLLLLEKHFATILDANPYVPSTVTLNDPFRGGSAQQGRHQRHKLGFGLEINRSLYLFKDDSSQLEPVPEAIYALNQAFTAFVQELIPLMSEAGAQHQPLAV